MNTPALSPADAGSKTGTEKRLVLVADDDPVTLRMLIHHLRDAGYETIAAKDGWEATQLMNGDVNVALFDLEMPGVSGLECLRYVREHYRNAVVIMVSGTGEIRDAVAAMKQGALDYLTKPFEPDNLIARVNQACWASQLARDNRGLREAVNLAGPSSDFVARTPAAVQLLRQVARVAPLDSTVLITGESGTGKTTVARLIHQSGPRASGPFVTVNCASLPRDLVESELFGHAKGAFTGAFNDRPGRAEIADGGTLFLDEIGDLPLELQPKLLTFLQDCTFQRIGSNKVYTVNVRIITATHQDLATMCQEKRFREDLYFRLNVIAIYVPALRERVDDIPELTQQILSRIGRRRNLPALTCDPVALDALLRYPWRGNVRELENVLERASAFCEGDTIWLEDLLFPSLYPGGASFAPQPTHRHGDQTHPDPSCSAGGSPTVPPARPTLAGRTLNEIEQQSILDTLAACGGNKAEAARRLGISEKSIYNKMKRFGLRTER